MRFSHSQAKTEIHQQKCVHVNEGGIYALICVPLSRVVRYLANLREKVIFHTGRVVIAYPCLGTIINNPVRLHSSKCNKVLVRLGLCRINIWPTSSTNLYQLREPRRPQSNRGVPPLCCIPARVRNLGGGYPRTYCLVEAAE